MPRPEIQNLIPVGTKTLLDVGCSGGDFGKAISDRLGCEVWGIEPVEKAVIAAKEKLNWVHHGFFEDALPFIDRKFDTVTFNDVLEHMPDPWKALEQTRTLLNKGGTVIASVPNVFHYQEFLDNFLAQDWKLKEAGVMDRTHLRWFTRKSLTRMFEDSGYEVIEVMGLDPTPSKKMTLISLCSFGKFSDMRYPQFALIAKARQ